MKQFNSVKMSAAVIYVFFLFGCTLERDNPYDPHGVNYNPDLYPSSSSPLSSSSLPSVLVSCEHVTGCAKISAEACFAFGGKIVASCPASSSSHLLAEVSSSSGVSDGSSSSHLLAEVSSSSGISDGSSSSSSEAVSSSSALPSSSSSVPSSSSLAPSSSSLSHIGKGNNISNYRTIAIGTQTWMAENLDYVVEGSKCYDNDPANCNEYGSLYDWATAMALPSSCNSAYCWSQVQSPHQGICPSGWHIPSNADWDKLYRFADGTSDTDSHYVSPTAGKHLKSKSGWNPSSGIENLDTYGFSALPGGYGYSNGFFWLVGNVGYWWSATEYNSGNDYGRYIRYDSDLADVYDLNRKSTLQSVRCVQD